MSSVISVYNSNHDWIKNVYKRFLFTKSRHVTSESQKFDWKEMFKIDFWAATATAHFFAQKLGPFLSILKKVKKNIIF